MAWNAHLPCPEAIVRMIELAGDDAGAARDRLEHAFALDCQIRDCCWEGIGAAGLALLDVGGGHADAAALERVEDAVRRSVREPDAWLWGHGFVLDLACAFGVRHGLELAGSVALNAAELVAADVDGWVARRTCDEANSGEVTLVHHRVRRRPRGAETPSLR